jgi:hypothetical protein
VVSPQLFIELDPALRNVAASLIRLDSAFGKPEAAQFDCPAADGIDTARVRFTIGLPQRTFLPTAG